MWLSKKDFEKEMRKEETKDLVLDDLNKIEEAEFDKYSNFSIEYEVK